MLIIRQKVGMFLTKIIEKIKEDKDYATNKIS